MHIKKGKIKLSPTDIKNIEIFIWHAERDMEYLGEGTYGRHSILNTTVDKASLNKGKKGMLCLQNLVAYTIREM